ncbi:MAG TPA: DUF2339 domain-containing protein [Gaiellaceae bacterium]|nr:DUF2339 domain-containing protein [Gaiellaceae bacterium]
MEQRLERLEAQLAALTERLARVEAALGEPPPRQRAPQPSSVRAPAAVADEPAPAPPRERVSLEDLLGGRVLAWVGAAAVVLGVVFFLVMAASRGWIDEPTRTLLALVGSSALLAGALWLHERQGRTQAALAAAATAITALYATLVAATQLYELVNAPVGLAFAALVAATATVLAVRWREQVVAGVGVVGALLAPILVGARTDHVTLGFVVVALAAAVGVLVWQRWSWLRVVVLLVTLPQLAGWLADDNALGLELAVLGGFWLLFAVAALGYELRVPVTGLRLVSASLLLLNAATLAGGGWLVLHDAGHERGATAWVVAAAAVHVGVALPAYRGRMSDEIAALLVAVGTALAGVGLALALDGPALVVGWAAEAVVLGYAARRFGDRRGHVGAAVFLVLASAATLTDEAPPDGLRVAVDGFGSAAVAVAVVGLAAAALAWLSRDLEGEGRVQPWQAYAALAAAAAVYLPSLAIVAAFGGDVREPRQTPQVLLSAFWAVTGVAAIVAGLVRDVRLLRLAGLVLLGVVVVKVFAYDLSELDSVYRALSFIALGLLLLGAAFAYQRVRRELRP